MLRDEELVKIVLDSDEFKRASSINEVKNVVRRVLRKRLIDLHIDDSNDVTVRECLVNRHIEWIYPENPERCRRHSDDTRILRRSRDISDTREHNPATGCER